MAVAAVASLSAARFSALGAGAPAIENIDARCRKARREVEWIMVPALPASGCQCAWHRAKAVASTRVLAILFVVPSILRIGPYRFFFFANENGEPQHVHVQRDRMLAKFWLSPVALASSSGFPAQELTRLLGMVEANHRIFVEAWNGFFGS